jgi:hypothetical protein
MKAQIMLYNAKVHMNILLILSFCVHEVVHM